MPRSAQHRGRPRRPAARRRRPRPAAAGRRTCAAGPSRVDPGGRVGLHLVAELAGLGALVEVAGEPAAQHLGDRGHVVGRAPDRRSGGTRSCGQPVLEDDHAGDHVGALDLRDVVALDAQRRGLQAERLGDLLQRLAAGGQVAGPAAACAAPAPAAALRSTVSSSAFLSPRCGTRMRHPAAPRARLSQSASASASAGSSGTSSSRGTSVSPCSPP